MFEHMRLTNLNLGAIQRLGKEVCYQRKHLRAQQTK
jgi:hypothetical protein